MRELIHPTNVLLPAMPLHELTHALVGRLVGADVEMGIDEWGPFASFEWPQSVTKRDVQLTHIAPTIVGATMGVLLGAMGFLLFDVVQVVGYVSADLVRLFAAVYITTNWIVYSWPSEADRAPITRDP